MAAYISLKCYVFAGKISLFYELSVLSFRPLKWSTLCSIIAKINANIYTEKGLFGYSTLYFWNLQSLYNKTAKSYQKIYIRLKILSEKGKFHANVKILLPNPVEVW